MDFQKTSPVFFAKNKPPTRNKGSNLDVNMVVTRVRSLPRRRGSPVGRPAVPLARLGPICWHGPPSRGGAGPPDFHLFLRLTDEGHRGMNAPVFAQ